MRALFLLLLTFGFVWPAFAQLTPINTPPNGAPATNTSGVTGARPLTATGKIQIGYDRRADYPSLQAKSAAKGVANPPANQNLDGTIFDSRASASGLPAPSVTKATPSTQATVAEKPRSDSALRSDSSPARDAAAAAQAEAAAKAAEEKKKADAIATAIAAAQKAGALPIKPQ